MKLARVASRAMVPAGMLAMLAAGWIYLFVHSNAVSSEEQNKALALLKDIKQLDADWSADVLRSHTDINLNYDALTAPLQPFADVSSALRGRAAALGDATIMSALEEVDKTIARKAGLVDAFKAQNSLYKNSLRYVPTAHQDIQARMRVERDAGLSSEIHSRRETDKAFDALEKSMAGAGSRQDIDQALSNVRGKLKSAAGSRVSAAAMALEGDISALVGHALRYSSVPDKDAAETVRSGIERLRATQGSHPEPVRESVANLIVHLETLLRLRSKQADLLRQISKVPVAANVDAVAALLAGRFSAELATQFQFQRYLLAYSAFALLLVIAGTSFILYRNATERRRLNALVAEQTAVLKENEVQLVHAQKMSAIGEMVAGVAHEVNTPLAAVKSSLQSSRELLAGIGDYFESSGKFIELCALPKPADETGRRQRQVDMTRQYKEVNSLRESIASFDSIAVVDELMGDGIRSVEHIYSVVVNMLNFSRLDSTKVVRARVEDGITSTLGIANHLLRSVKVTTSFGQTQPVSCDLAQINQVVLNLVKNAAQALPASGGEIVIRTSMRDQRHVQIDVQDNGSGIPPEVLPKIWEPFFTTKPEGVGTGLGLSTCRKIIAAHGGSMEVESRPGEGTTFSVILPLSPPQSLYEQHGQQAATQLVAA